MLQQNFTPPDPEISRTETRKRMGALKAFVPKIQTAITSLTVTGSMATGQNYAVTEKSDIDMQITVTKESITNLDSLNIFPRNDLEIPIRAYQENKIGQFSVSINIDGISHECHFWDEQALIDAMELKSQETKRIRSNNNSPAIDFAFSFDGSEHEYECPTEKLGDIYISTLPTYRIIKEKLYISRSVTNWLSLPYIVYGKDLLEKHIDNSWQVVTKRLVEESNGTVDLSAKNILNALPSKYKASPESKEKILERTKTEILKLGADFKQI